MSVVLRSVVSLGVFWAALICVAVIIRPANVVNVVADAAVIALIALGVDLRFPWAYLGRRVRRLVGIAGILGLALFLGQNGLHAQWSAISAYNGLGIILEILFATRWAVAPILSRRRIRDPLVASAPLRGRVFVTSGGSNSATNRHGHFSEYRYALDMVLTDKDCRRARTVSPRALDDFYAFGAPVFAPIDGAVTAIETSLFDQRPGERGEQLPEGNFVEISSDQGTIVIAHLQQNSIMIAVGDRVRAGQRIAAVGNTGNTTEPHLHVHALRAGASIPIIINGRFLVRNDLICA